MNSRIHRQYAQERVHWGSPFTEIVAREMSLLGVSRAFILTSPSAAHAEGPASALVDHLGDQCVGIYAGCRPHSPRECGINAANAARECGAELLVAVGGGSVIDTAKLAQLCLWRNVSRAEQLDANRREPGLDASIICPHRAGLPRIVAVPTTFSAAEFTYFAGIKNEERGIKESFAAWHLIPRTVILDPGVSLSTPIDILLATGFKALDHAIEGHLSVLAEPVYGPLRIAAVQKLLTGLEALHADPQSLAARSQCLEGMWSSMAGSMGFGVGGISHTLGAILGGHAGISHGTTSCITLPAVLDVIYSGHPRLLELQSALSKTLIRSLSETIASMSRRFGLSMTLSEFRITQSQHEQIAGKIMLDRPPFQHHLENNLTHQQVLALLNACQ